MDDSESPDCPSIHFNALKLIQYVFFLVFIFIYLFFLTFFIIFFIYCTVRNFISDILVFINSRTSLLHHYFVLYWTKYPLSSVNVPGPKIGW